jgi:LAO/AO transport system kinase
MSNIADLVADATGGKREALARLLSIAELGDHRLLEIESCVSPHVGRAHVIGITGPPGAGKSTLINALLPLAQGAFGKAAVLAVDPSSPFSKGAILGDRVRMQSGQLGSSVFIRSMASRGEAGGLARAASTCVRLFDACQWPVVVIETLGIGQVELEIMNLADTVVVVLNPGWGDSIQANKAGITEAGDIFVINKADKPGVEQTRKDLMESFSLLRGKPIPEIVETTATSGKGLAELWQAIEEHRNFLLADGDLQARRALRRRRIIRKLICDHLASLSDIALSSDRGRRLVDETAAGEIEMPGILRAVLAIMSEEAARE